MTERTVRIGSRGSALALWQSNHVAGLLRSAHRGLNVEIEVFSTRGDEVLDTPLPAIGGKGLFTAELEQALRAGVIDLAVHSLKDLPTDDPDGLTVGAIPARAPVHDVLVSRGNYRLDDLPQGAAVGTSSHRRAAQIRAHRPDLRTIDLRGNVPTRVRKAQDPDGPYDAIVLARAGLARLEMHDAIRAVLPLEIVLPAPGQGALAVQCRDDAASHELLAPLDDHNARLSVSAERAFLAALGGGCSVPVAAYGEVPDGVLSLRGRVSALDGSRQIDVAGVVTAPTLDAARALGRKLADEARQRGAADILGAIGG